MSRSYQGREIIKTTINLGIAGQIELSINGIPPLSLVEFRAKARVGSVKIKFREDGAAEEITILTIDPASFKILGVEATPEQQQLPLQQTAVTIAETDAVIRAMSLKGALLVACEACGHAKSDHVAPLCDGDGPGGKCINAACQCEAYVPFPEAPAEENLEELTHEDSSRAAMPAEAQAEEVPG